jgi:hypothetical protein
MDKGIEGAAVLVSELDRLSAASRAAAAAPRSRAIYQYLTAGLDPRSDLGSDPSGDIAALTATLILRLGVWWSRGAYGRLPVMVPWCVRDRKCRYDQGPESWGAPNADGYLRDDNSIIKKLPLPIAVTGPPGHPYAGRRPWRGFTACHIWRDLPDGSLAGANPWLYSFMPNLIWLPSWLAPLTDRQDSPVQRMLQRVSCQRFLEAPVAPALRGVAGYAWGLLPSPVPGPAVASETLPEFDPDEAFFRRRLAYLDKFIAGAGHVIAHGTTGQKLICSRYTEGLPALPSATVERFRDQMCGYRDALSGDALAA